MTERMSYIEARQALAPPKRHKYGAKRVTVEGKSFASKLEGKVYAELRMLERAGKINSIWPQYPFTLTTTDAKGVKHKIAIHRVDFRIFDCGKKEFRYIECKGADHKDGKLRRKWAEAEHGVKIEVRRA